jgi:hypothetical protein
MNEIKITGRVNLKCYDKNGKLKWEVDKDNLITSAGKAALAGLAGDTGSIDAFTYLAVGTDSTDVNVNQTTLEAEITDTGLARSAATVTRTTTTVTNDTLTLEKTWTVTGTKTIEEAGVFNASSDGVMLGRALTTSKLVNNGEDLVLSYSIKFA